MGPLIRVYDGRDMSLITEFRWGGPGVGTRRVHIATCDLTRTGGALVAVAPDVGGGPSGEGVRPRAGGRKSRELHGACRTRSAAACGSPWGDVDGDKIPDLLAAPGPCDYPPVVRVFSGKDWKLIGEYAAFDQAVAAAALVGSRPRTGTAGRTSSSGWTRAGRRWCG